MGNTHDDGRLFGTDGRGGYWWELTLELVAPPAPADNVTVTLFGPEELEPFTAAELEAERDAFRAGEW